MRNPIPLVVLIILFCSPPAFADRVELTNGDRMTGELQSIKEGTVTFKHAGIVGGTATFPAREIVELTTDREFQITMLDGKKIVGKIVFAKGGGVRIVPSGTTSEVVIPRWSDLTSALPPVQPEPPPPPIERKSVWSGNFGLSGQMLDVTRDQRSLALSINGSVTEKSDEDRLKLSMSYMNISTTDEKRVDGEKEEITTTTRSTTGQAKYDYYVSSPLYSYAHIEQEKIGGPKKIFMRNTRGVGIGWDLFATPETNLSAEAGYSRASTEYENSSILDLERDSTTRLSIWGNRRIAEALTLTLSTTFFLYPDLTSGAHFSRTEGGVNLGLTKRWTLTFGATNRYDDIVPEDAGKDEIIYTSGIGFQF